MSFNDFLQIVLPVIEATAGIVTISQAFVNHKEERENFSKAEWLKLCKKMKKYISNHPELGIEIHDASSKTGATGYEYKKKRKK
ncbi:MAG: hypothetical protein MJ057_09425 [Sphaerochaetaceae bacterium]|nr:hypothetical protein [Sphaerochaetaceae bacterium]